MLSSNEIKLIRSLRDKKFRRERGLFVVEGEKMVEEALRSRYTVEAVYRREEIGEAAMRRISMLASPSPALAVVRIPADGSAVPDMPLGPGLFLALDGIRDPGNLGTLLRIADWFGIDGVLASPDTVEFFNPKAVQATMGAIFRVRFGYADLPAACRRAVSEGGAVYGAFLDGDPLYGRTLSRGDTAPTVIVIGSEPSGISPEAAAEVTGRLFIPPHPPGRAGAESLNAAVAAAIVIAEFRRDL